MRQGEVRQRLDTTAAVPQHVLVVSGQIYNGADTGRVIACRVLSGHSLLTLAGCPRNVVPSTIVLDRLHRVAAIVLTAPLDTDLLRGPISGFATPM